MKLLHFSDQHWQPGSIRHDEYKIICSELFEQAKTLNIDGFVLTGDCVHEKTQRITPELIDCLVWFFKNLSDIAPVYMILGNHDGNLANKNRQDAISPIINAINRSNIFLYKQSGVYPINDEFNFCVFSCFDEEGWNRVKAEQDKINIALYHGGIFGALTDTGHMFENEIDQTFFDSFDYVLLGDIHKQQYLSSDRRIAYAGSFIQQNFGEEIDEHGFLLWDIRSKKDFNVNFKKLKNIQPFVSLEFNGSEEELILKSKRYPEGSRFRILSEFPLSEKEKSTIELELKEKNKSNHIVYKFDKKTQDITLNNNKLKENIRNKSYLVKLAKDFFGQNKLNVDQWNEAEDIIDSYLSKLNEETDRNVKCHIKRLEFSNLFGYGENNVIDFDQINGIVGIMGENSIGKSSIIATIIFSLFGTTDRDLGQGRAHYVINNNKSECFTKVWFTVSGTDYVIERKSIRKSKGDRFSAQNFVQFFESYAGELKSIGGIDPTDTNKEITKRIGNVEDFLLTNVAAQRNMGRFIDEKSTKRKEIVSRFRDLLILDDIFNLIRKDLNGIEAQLKDVEFKNWDEIIENLAQEKISLTGELKEFTSDFELYFEKNSITGNSLSELLKQETVRPSDISNKEKELIKLNNSLESLEKTYESNHLLNEEYNNKLKEVVNSKNLIPVDVYKEKISINKKIEKELIELENELIRKRDNLKQKEKTVSKLNVVPCGDQFPTCLYIKDAHEEKKNIPQLNDLILNLENKIKEIKLKFSDYKTYEEEIQKYSQLTEKENNLVYKISSTNTETYILKISETKKNISSLIQELDAMKKSIKDEVEEKISLLQEEQKIISSKLKELDKKKIVCAQRIGQINSEYIQSRDNKKKYDELSKKHQIYNVLLDIFSKKGIQSQIMKIELPYINKEIKNVLEGNVNFSLELEIDEESDKLEIYLEDDKGGRRPIECCGGMQHVVASMAIRFALSESSNLPKMNIIVFDEAFNALDSNHVDSVFKIFYSLKKWFKSVIVISHDERVKNICDMSLEIKDNGKYSFVCNE